MIWQYVWYRNNSKTDKSNLALQLAAYFYLCRMADKLAAHYENRIYYFYIVDKKPGELSIRMYDTPYTFLLKDGEWINHATNKMAMTGPLIQVVAETADAD